MEGDCIADEEPSTGQARVVGVSVILYVESGARGCIVRLNAGSVG